MTVKKIAIIGAGPSGLVSLNEFLHTSADGISTIDTLKNEDIKLPQNPAFGEIVVFEQNNDIGGVWLYNENHDPNFPQADDYSDPFKVRPNLNAPSMDALEGHSNVNPFIRPIIEEKKLQSLWNKSAVYDNLFTNVPNRLMRFTSGFDIEVDGTGKESNIFYPFVSHNDVLKYLKKYADRFDLRKHVRFNTVVEKVFKKGEKWIVVVVQFNLLDNTERWYKEEFDAVLCSVGRFNVPFIPAIEGLNEFNKNHPDVLSHTKSFRNTNNFKGKKVLLVGGSVSAVDLLQYLIPDCKEVWLSTNTSAVKFGNNEASDWMSQILNDQSLPLHRCARIKRFTENAVEFEDGTVSSDFDRILFATGYHLSYPFLNIEENKGKNYIKVGSGNDYQPNYAKTKVENVYLYIFTVGEPTLAHIGLCQNPLFFLVAEIDVIAMAGVWSGAKELPSIEKQKEWCTDRLKGKTSNFQKYDENSIIPYIRDCYKLSPENRFDMTQIFIKDEVKESRKVLKDLFYKYAYGELKN